MEKKNLMLLILTGLVALAIIGGAALLVAQKKNGARVNTPQALLIQRKDVPAGLSPETLTDLQTSISEKPKVVIYNHTIATKGISISNQIYVFALPQDMDLVNWSELLTHSDDKPVMQPDWKKDKNVFIYQTVADTYKIGVLSVKQNNYLWTITVAGNNIAPEMVLLTLQDVYEKYQPLLQKTKNLPFSETDYQKNLTNVLPELFFIKKGQ